MRRDKSILHNIPPCQEITLYHGLTKFQCDLYKSILSHNRGNLLNYLKKFYGLFLDFFFDQTNSKSCSQQSLMTIWAQLSKAVNHPYLFKGLNF